MRYWSPRRMVVARSGCTTAPVWILAQILVVLVGLIWSPPADAQWVALWDQNNAFARDCPDDLLQLLGELGRQGATLKSVEFAPGGGWIVLLDRNGYRARNIPEAAFKKLGTLAGQGAEIKSVSFTPSGGWAILFDRVGIETGDIPAEAAQKLGELARQGVILKSITFAPGGGWVILAGKNTYLARNIPDEAFEKLGELKRRGTELRSISFAPGGGWVIFGDRNTYFARGIPDEAFQKLGEVARRGGDLHSVRFPLADLPRLSGDDDATRAEIRRRMDRHKVPGLGIAVIEDGKVLWARGYGTERVGQDQPVGPQTRFQAASISKPIAALTALRLVERGSLTLDGDLNSSLKSWKIPPSPTTRPGQPTLRQLLSHGGGFSVHGFAGYRVGNPMPTLLDILDGKPPANSQPIRVQTLPGSQMRYSGGGYTVVQQLIMDATGEPFPRAVATLVLDPLSMKDSSYGAPSPAIASNFAAGHIDGATIPGGWHVYPELAAAGLWTTPTDIARFLIGVQRAQAGEPKAILPPALVGEMLRRQQGDAGLGVILTGDGPSAWFTHDGVNAGFECGFRASVRSNQGAVIMTNATGGGALVRELFECLRAEYAWPNP